jgi:hypothetical protein
MQLMDGFKRETFFSSHCSALPGPVAEIPGPRKGIEALRRIMLFLCYMTLRDARREVIILVQNRKGKGGEMKTIGMLGGISCESTAVY